MAEFSYPFDTGAGATVTQDMWSRMAKYWSGRAIPGDSASTNLKVTTTGSSMTTTVSVGEASILGYFYYNDAAVPVVHAANSSGNPRIDVVVLRLDTVADKITVGVVQGTPAISPAVPTLAGNWSTLTSTVYEMPLAYVTVPTGAAAIAGTNIADMRYPGLAPIYTGTAATIPTYNAKQRPMGSIHFQSDTREWLGWDGTKWSTIAGFGAWKTYNPVINWDDGTANGQSDPNWTTLGRYKLLSDNTVSLSVYAKMTAISSWGGTYFLRVSLPFQSAAWPNSNDTQFSTLFQDGGGTKRQAQGQIFSASNWVNRFFYLDDTTKHLETMTTATQGSNIQQNGYLRFSCVYEINGL